jgi:hypothetical protein
LPAKQEIWAVAAGVYLMLAPLPTGRHAIRTLTVFEDDGRTVDTMYLLDIAAGKS